MPEPGGSNHTKRATYALRQRIMRGELRGGTRLYEVAVAEELSISRTPVREALSRLAEEGLVERAPGGGVRVRSFSLEDVLDAIELRGVLEGTAARMAAERGVGARELTRIGGLVAQLDLCFSAGGAPIDFDSYSELNAAFHAELSGLCGSTIIRREIERVSSLPFASPSAFVLGKEADVATHRSLIFAQAQHRALVAAIEARAGSRAEAIAREHAQIARVNLEASRQIEDELGARAAVMGLVVE